MIESSNISMQVYLHPGTNDLQKQYLLLVLVFSSCSFCLACQSSSSTLAFSFHSASCLREFLSVEREAEIGVFKNWIRKQQRKDIRIKKKKSELFRSKTNLLIYCTLPSTSSLSLCSSLHLRRLSGSA